MVVTRSMSGTSSSMEAAVAGTNKVHPKRVSRKRRTAPPLDFVDMARAIFKEETYGKRLREKHPYIKITPDVLKAAEEEWDSMSDSDKAMYITEAEKKYAEIQKIINQNPIIPEAKPGGTKTLDTKRAERAREDLIFGSYIIFIQEIYLPQQREKHPYRFLSNGWPSDLAAWAGRVKWVFLSDDEKDMYLAEAKRRADEDNEACKRFKRGEYGRMTESDKEQHFVGIEKRVAEFVERVRKYKSGESG